MRDTGVEALTIRRRRWIVVAPWAVAVVVGAVALLAPRAPAASVAPTAGPMAAPSPAAPPAAPTADTAAPSGRLGADAAIAVLAASRAALGTHGLADTGGTAGDRWVLDQLLGAVTTDSSGIGLVRVHATVITAGADGWTGPSTAHVDVRVDPGPPVRVLTVAVPGATSPDAGPSSPRPTPPRPEDT